METKNPLESKLFKTNELEAEQIFRETCLWYESKFSPFDQAYQQYINNYHKAKSLFLITEGSNNRIELIVYDTESEIEEIKILKIPMFLNSNACITLLPNGELFCFCKFSNQNKALIIDNNYDVRFLPSSLPLFNSSAIYFEGNIYCFGGEDECGQLKSFSRKFNLIENRWINLIPMPKTDYYCNCVIFNEDILICGYKGNLLLYSVGADSFSIIPYNFLYCWKMLINAERFYLIESSGFIYESEVENEFAWRLIESYNAMNNFPSQMYCVYNKAELYISVESIGERYFKFDIKQKIMTKFNKRWL